MDSHQKPIQDAQYDIKHSEAHLSAGRTRESRRANERSRLSLLRLEVNFRAVCF